jgi:hypothetical protein
VLGVESILKYGIRVVGQKREGRTLASRLIQRYFNETPSSHSQSPETGSSGVEWGATYLGVNHLSPLVHVETLKMRKQGGFRGGCSVSVSVELAGNRSLGKDEGECL